MIRLAAALLLCLVLIACSAITGPRTEFAVYTLNPPAAPTTSTARTPSDWHLAIDEPHALGLLDSDRLVVAPDANERLAFTGVRWNERAPVLLQNIWLRTFEGDGRFGGVVRSNSGTRTALVLASDLTAFQIEHHGSQSEAVVAVQARLIDPRSRRSLAQAPFQARVGTDDTQARSAVAALEAAVAEVTSQLIAWTASEGERINTQLGAPIPAQTDRTTPQ